MKRRSKTITMTPELGCFFSYVSFFCGISQGEVVLQILEGTLEANYEECIQEMEEYFKWRFERKLKGIKGKENV